MKATEAIFLFFSLLLWVTSGSPGTGDDIVTNSAIYLGVYVTCSGPRRAYLTISELNMDTVWQCSFRNAGTAVRSVNMVSTSDKFESLSDNAASVSPDQTVFLRMKVRSGLTQVMKLETVISGVVVAGAQQRQLAFINVVVHILPEPIINSRGVRVIDNGACALVQSDNEGFEGFIELLGDDASNVTLPSVRWSSEAPIELSSSEKWSVSISQTYFKLPQVLRFYLTADIDFSLSGGAASLVTKRRQCVVVVNRGPIGIAATMTLLDEGGRSTREWNPFQTYTAQISGWRHPLNLRMLFSIWGYPVSNPEQQWRLTPDIESHELIVTLPFIPTGSNFAVLAKATDIYDSRLVTCSGCAIQKPVKGSTTGASERVARMADTVSSNSTLDTLLKILTNPGMSDETLMSFLSSVTQWLASNDVNGFVEQTAPNWAAHLRQRGTVTQYDMAVAGIFSRLVDSNQLSMLALRGVAVIYGVILRRLAGPVVVASEEIWRDYPKSVRSHGHKFAPQGLIVPVDVPASAQLLRAHIEVALQKVAAMTAIRDINCIQSDPTGLKEMCYTACTFTDDLSTLISNSQKMAEAKEKDLSDGAQALLRWLLVNEPWLTKVSSTLPNMVTVASIQILDECNSLKVVEHLFGPMWRVQLWNGMDQTVINPGIQDVPIAMPLASFGQYHQDCTMTKDGWDKVEVIPRSPLQAYCLTNDLDAWITLSDPNQFYPATYGPFPWVWLLISEALILIFLCCGLALWWWKTRPPKHSEEILADLEDTESNHSEQNENVWGKACTDDTESVGEQILKGKYWERRTGQAGSAPMLQGGEPATAREADLLTLPRVLSRRVDSASLFSPLNQHRDHAHALLTPTGRPANPLHPIWMTSPRCAPLGDAVMMDSDLKKPQTAIMVDGPGSEGQAAIAVAPDGSVSVQFPSQVCRIPTVVKDELKPVIHPINWKCSKQTDAKQAAHVAQPPRAPSTPVHWMERPQHSLMDSAIRLDSPRASPSGATTPVHMHWPSSSTPRQPAHATTMEAPSPRPPLAPFKRNAAHPESGVAPSMSVDWMTVPRTLSQQEVSLLSPHHSHDLPSAARPYQAQPGNVTPTDAEEADAAAPTSVRGGASGRHSGVPDSLPVLDAALMSPIARDGPARSVLFMDTAYSASGFDATPVMAAAGGEAAVGQQPVGHDEDSAMSQMATSMPPHGAEVMDISRDASLHAPTVVAPSTTAAGKETALGVEAGAAGGIRQRAGDVEASMMSVVGGNWNPHSVMNLDTPRRDGLQYLSPRVASRIPQHASQLAPPGPWNQLPSQTHMGAAMPGSTSDVAALMGRQPSFAAEIMSPMARNRLPQDAMMLETPRNGADLAPTPTPPTVAAPAGSGAPAVAGSQSSLPVDASMMSAVATRYLPDEVLIMDTPRVSGRPPVPGMPPPAGVAAATAVAPGRPAGMSQQMPHPTDASLMSPMLSHRTYNRLSQDAMSLDTPRNGRVPKSGSALLDALRPPTFQADATFMSPIGHLVPNDYMMLDTPQSQIRSMRSTSAPHRRPLPPELQSATRSLVGPSQAITDATVLATSQGVMMPTVEASLMSPINSQRRRSLDATFLETPRNPYRPSPELGMAAFVQGPGTPMYAMAPAQQHSLPPMPRQHNGLQTIRPADGQVPPQQLPDITVSMMSPVHRFRASSEVFMLDTPGTFSDGVSGVPVHHASSSSSRMRQGVSARAHSAPFTPPNGDAAPQQAMTPVNWMSVLRSDALHETFILDSPRGPGTLSHQPPQSGPYHTLPPTRPPVVPRRAEGWQSADVALMSPVGASMRRAASEVFILDTPRHAAASVTSLSPAVSSHETQPTPPAAP